MADRGEDRGREHWEERERWRRGTQGGERSRERQEFEYGRGERGGYFGGEQGSYRPGDVGEYHRDEYGRGHRGGESGGEYREWGPNYREAGDDTPHGGVYGSREYRGGAYGGSRGGEYGMSYYGGSQSGGQSRGSRGGEYGGRQGGYPGGEYEGSRDRAFGGYGAGDYGGSRGDRGGEYAASRESADQEWSQGHGDWSQSREHMSGPHIGRGPKGYQRSDERIREDVCERLTRHGRIDATEIDVQVRSGEVTLTGTVESRQAKRMAEDTVESISGVKEVSNQLRVQEQGQRSPQGAPRPSGEQRGPRAA